MPNEQELAELFRNDPDPRFKKLGEAMAERLKEMLNAPPCESTRIHCFPALDDGTYGPCKFCGKPETE